MFTDVARNLTQFLHLYPLAGVGFAFIIAFIESLALVGTVIPGSVTLTFFGILMGSGAIPLVPSLMVIMLGGFLGDGLSFWVGHHYKDRLRNTWIFKRYPAIIKNGEYFVQQHGGKSIVIGRFVGPVRSVLPVIAGMLGLSVKRFIIADAVSSVGWAIAYTFPGILIGAASLELPPKLATALIIFILSAIFIIWLLCKLIQIFCKNIAKAWTKHCEQVASKLIHYPMIKKILGTHHIEKNIGLLFFSIIFVLLFIILSLSLIYIPQLQSLNQIIMHLAQSLRTPILITLMVGFTILAEKKVVACIVLVILITLLLRRAFKQSVIWVGHFLTAALLVKTLKLLFAFPRPPGLLTALPTYSFPSGHVTLAFALYGLLGVLLPRRIQKISLLFIATMIAVSRIYLNAHWLTDTVGGAFLGLSIAMFTAFLWHRIDDHRVPLDILKRWVLISTLTVSAIVAFHDGHVLIKKYQLNFPTKIIQYNNWWSQNGKPIIDTYHLNRRGFKSDRLNIQFMGTLNCIKNSLNKQSWQTRQTTNWQNFIPRVLGANKPQQLPIMPHLYRNQRPKLILSLQTTPQSPLLILRLWQSGLKFSDNKNPLWLGSIHYKITWHHYWLRRHQREYAKVTPAIPILRKNLAGQSGLVIRNLQSILLIKCTANLRNKEMDAKLPS